MIKHSVEDVCQQLRIFNSALAGTDSLNWTALICERSGVQRMFIDDWRDKTQDELDRIQEYDPDCGPAPYSWALRAATEIRLGFNEHVWDLGGSA